MAYNRQPQTVLAGTALTQNPPPSVVQPAGIVPVTLDANVATATDLGVVQVGSGLSITPGGVLSATGGGAVVGTWTPTISVATAGTITLTINTARYTKIGQQVTCYYDFTVATRAGGNNNNILTLNGLPFTSSPGTGKVGSLVATYWTGLNTDETNISGTVPGNSNSVELWTVHQAKLMSGMTYQDLIVGSRLVGTITYLSAT